VVQMKKAATKKSLKLACNCLIIKCGPTRA